MKVPEPKLLAATAILAVLIFVAMAISPYIVPREPAPPLHAAKLTIAPRQSKGADLFQSYPETFAAQIAVLITPGEDTALTPVRVLKAMGIPFFLTRDLHRALAHKLVLIYPSIDFRSFRPDEAQLIQRFVEDGGNIFAQNVFWGGLKSVFGFTACVPLRTRHRMVLADVDDPVLRYLDRPEEKEVQLGSTAIPEVIWTNGYSPDTSAVAVARFDDGSAAIISKQLGKGRAYLIGVALNDVVLRDQQNRDYEAQRIYVNGFEPGADVWLLILRAWYEQYSEGGIRVATIPDGKRSVLMLSHDVDWEYSFRPALDIARAEQKRGLKSTFFVQTKYLDDYNSHAFFIAPNLDLLRQLKSEGDEIGSHTVIHSRGFNHVKLGWANVSYSNYRPHATGFDSFIGATALGETCVSKSLLDGELNQQTAFFRAGHLRVPAALPEALQRCGYQFDSSFTADDVLTNFPYRLNLDLGMMQETQVYEFPVTIEDEESALTSRMDRVLDLINANADNNAPSVLLVHSNNAEDKLTGEEEILDRLPTDISALSMSAFARFWKARDELHWKVRPSGPHSFEIEAISGSNIDGLTFSFNQTVERAFPGSEVSALGKSVVLQHLRANVPFHFGVVLMPATKH
ncbi:MAG TPA: polysaccharide deacetylase family protein [Terriglobales bacterium]|nr:polysaccharide deacetylase family protein [Terriglobales bacterium]